MFSHESMVFSDLRTQLSLIAPGVTFAGQNQKRSCQEKRCGVKNSVIQGLGVHRSSSFVPLDDEHPWIVISHNPPFSAVQQSCVFTNNLGVKSYVLHE
jgi:hypothetical protein